MLFGGRALSLFKIETALRDGSSEMDMDAEVCNLCEFRLIYVNGVNMVTLSKHFA